MRRRSGRGRRLWRHRGRTACGVTAREVPIRGGTDGARLSYEGLPCPNLCTGGENFHGRFEYIPLEDMEKVAEILTRIILDAAK